jgi:aromatase
MTGHVDNTIIVEAPMDVVWRMTNDVASWPQLFTEYAEAEILTQDGMTTRFRLLTHPDEEGRQWEWESERTVDPRTHTVRARRMGGAGPFDFMNIRWAYREVPGGVEMRWEQEFHVRDHLPFGDDEMAGHLNENTQVQMRAVKERIEESARETTGR